MFQISLFCSREKQRTFGIMIHGALSFAAFFAKLSLASLVRGFDLFLIDNLIKKTEAC